MAFLFDLFEYFGISEKLVPRIEIAELPNEIKEAARLATPYFEGRSIDLDMSYNELKVMAYVKDRQLVTIGTIDGYQLKIAKMLIQSTNYK